MLEYKKSLSKQIKQNELDTLIKQKKRWQVSSYIITSFCIFVSSASSVFSFISANVNYQILTLASGILTICIGFFNGFSSYIQKKVAEISDEITSILNIFGIKIKVDNVSAEIDSLDLNVEIPIGEVVERSESGANELEIEKKIFKSEIESTISLKNFWKGFSDVLDIVSLLLSCMAAVVSLVASAYNQFIATIIAGAINAAITVLNSIIVISKNKYSSLQEKIKKMLSFED